MPPSNAAAVRAVVMMSVLPFTVLTSTIGHLLRKHDFDLATFEERVLRLLNRMKLLLFPVSFERSW
jgi:hypothetical protein